MSHVITIFECNPVASHCWYYYDDELKSAKVVRNHIEGALEYWGYTNHNVTISTDTSYTSQKSDMESELNYFQDDWLPGHPDESSDSNLMLLDTDPSGSSGKAKLYGNAALKKKGADLADHAAYRADRYGDPTYAAERVIRGSVHEIGHNYTMRHGDGRRYDSGGETYATPHGCEIDYELQQENRCDKPCSQKSKDMNDHWFADCAEDKL
jgi:hypothetical protein